MPQYLLTRPHARPGLTLAAGSVLSTDAPEGSLFYIAPDEADRLLADGILVPDTTPVLTGVRDKETGWRQVPRERDDRTTQEGTDHGIA